MILVGLMVWILAVLAVISPAHRPSATAGPAPPPTPLDVARLSPAELEALALDALAALHERRRREASSSDGVRGRRVRAEGYGPRQVYLGMENARRLLPLAKRLTLKTLGETVRPPRLSREKRLIASVRRVVLDPALSGAAGIWEDDPSYIRVGPDYAALLTSDDETMLMLGHELTHVAARAGRLGRFIEGMGDTARRSTGLKLTEEQKEELACEFVGAGVLRHYIALRPTAEAEAERFARSFGYAPHPERLARAWEDFCASYNGDPVDGDHLSSDQTLRALLGLDPKFKALIPDDAISTRLCR